MFPVKDSTSTPLQESSKRFWWIFQPRSDNVSSDRGFFDYGFPALRNRCDQDVWNVSLATINVRKQRGNLWNSSRRNWKRFLLEFENGKRFGHSRGKFARLVSLLLLTLSMLRSINVSCGTLLRVLSLFVYRARDISSGYSELGLLWRANFRPTEWIVDTGVNYASEFIFGRHRDFRGGSWIVVTRQRSFYSKFLSQRKTHYDCEKEFYSIGNLRRS